MTGVIRLRLVVSVLVLAVSGCSEPGAGNWPVHVEVERVVDRSHLDHPLTLDRVRSVVSAEIGRSPLFVVGPGDGQTHRAEAWIAVVRDRHGARILELHVEMQPPTHLQRTLRDGLSATVVVEPRAGAIDPEKDLPYAAQRAAAVLEARVLLAEGRPENVRRVLRTEDPEILAESLDWVRDHRIVEAASRVAELLIHSDDRVSRAAVECMGVVGTARDVPQVLSAARLGDRGHTHRLYEALARLGGRQARSFLEFAVRNEDDPALAVAAAYALDQVKSGVAPRDVGSASPAGRIPRGHR